MTQQKGPQDPSTGQSRATVSRKDRRDSVAWLKAGLDHVWLPYAQMKTEPDPLPVVATRGSRIVLADGRELVDGLASWWTACHGYNHPHIREAVAHQLEVMPHVMFGGLAHARDRSISAGWRDSPR